LHGGPGFQYIEKVSWRLQTTNPRNLLKWKGRKRAIKRGFLSNTVIERTKFPFGILWEGSVSWDRLENAALSGFIRII